MSELYNRIELLCKKKGINITTMCKETGASRGSLTDLKSGRKKSLSTYTVSKIANYFNVSMDYILSGNKQTTVTDNDIKFALFNSSEGITDEMLDEVKQYAEMVKLREEQKRKDKIVQSKNNDEEIEVFVAARSEGNKDIPKTERMSKSEWEILKNLPETDDDF